MMQHSILGVVLAGGQSRRMGVNKAELVYQGITLLELAQVKCRDSVVSDVIISGPQPQGVKDTTPFSGPASAVFDVALSPRCNGFSHVFALPVDMPLFDTPLIDGLIGQLQSCQDSVYFEDYFLPIVLSVEQCRRVGDAVAKLANCSVRRLIDLTQARAIPLPSHIDASVLANVNTPVQWRQLTDNN